MEGIRNVAHDLLAIISAVLLAQTPLVNGVNGLLLALGVADDRRALIVSVFSAGFGLLGALGLVLSKLIDSRSFTIIQATAASTPVAPVMASVQLPSDPPPPLAPARAVAPPGPPAAPAAPPTPLVDPTVAVTGQSTRLVTAGGL